MSKPRKNSSFHSGRSKNLAAIDIGTNSFHLIVVDVDKRNRKFKILTREKEIVRLGSGSTDMKHLSENAMNRGIEALKRFKAIADAARAPVRAIATSAVREALNQSEFLRRVKSATGIKIEIASGSEESRLIYLGVLQALPVFNRKILLMDIGGGSTEFLIGRQREIFYENSLKLGAIRLTQRFFTSEKLTPKSVKQCRKFVWGTINLVSREIKKHDYDMAIGSSGTILNIASMIRLMRGEPAAIKTNNFSFSRRELNKIVEKLTKAKDVKQRAKIPGLDVSRADIIVAGALILEQIFEELNIKRMTVSEFALREGIILDTIEKQYKRKNFHPLNDIRYRSVLHLAENFKYEMQHSHHTAHLALRIFDQTRKLHKLGDAEREFLEAAALLHEIGFFISHSQHHRHSYYIVRNSELMGFTDNEKEIIANIARYHRKSHPKLKHEEFGRLTPEDQSVVQKLSAILRVADGLDRTHSSVVKDVTCKASGKNAAFILHREHKRTPVDLEIWGAERKKELFEEVFGVRVKFKARAV